jgi:hypothetical protein
MKSNDVSSVTRTLITSLVAVSLTGQQIAFAAQPTQAAQAPVAPSASKPTTAAPVPRTDVHALLPQAKTGKQAIVVIGLAESRPLSVYFQHGGTPDEIARLDADFKSLAKANALVGIADDLDSFEPWWDSHKTSILLSHDKVQDVNLENFFTQIFIVYKAEKTQAQKDPNQFVSWLSTKVTNPAVRYASFTAFALVLGTFSFTLGLVKGAMVAGPAASMVGAFVEPIVRPIREKASIVGSRLFGPWGVKLSSKIFNENGSAEGAAGDLNHLESDIASAREGAKEARALMSTMGYEMSPAQYAANMSKLHAIWNKTNQVWVQTNPALFRDGRDVFSNAIALRPQAYSGQIMQSLQGAEQARQAIEQHIDRIISRTGQNAQVVEESVVTLLRAVEINENASEANKMTAKEGLEQSRAALKTLGATDYQVDRIIESRLAELINVRHTAYTLAANLIHELQYEEYNRSLPDEVQKIQRALRDGTCLDYFHHEFKAQVSKILNEMEFRVDVAQKTVEAAKVAPNSPLKLSKAAALARKPRAAKAPEAPAKTGEPAKAAPRKAARQTPGDYVREKVSRATNALSRLNGLRSNRVAIERTGQLHDEHAATPEERAREAVRRVGKK